MNNTEFRTGVIKPVECVKEGWELIKSEYWLLFAITLVGALIGGVTMYVLLGAMMCGIFYCYLRKIDGKPITFEGLWKGFEWFAPGLLVTLFLVVPVIVLYVIIYVPVFMAMVMGERLSQEELIGMLVGAVAIDFLFIVLMVCFHTLLIFSFPLIVDRGLGGFQAMKTSAKAVWGNMGGVVGLIMVNIVLTLIGQLALCVGIYFVIPIILAGNVVAYRKVFPATNGDKFNLQHAYQRL